MPRADSRMIPYAKQWLDEDDIAAVVEVLKSDWLTTGPWVSEFEQKLAEYCGAKHAVAVSNGTVALHLACLAADIKEGDEGITSPITFVASANCLLYVGARPVFADIRPDTWNIDPSEIERKVTARTKAIIPVDFAGLPSDLKMIRQIADRHGLVVIEDACHAMGGTYDGKRIGGTGLSDMVCFSFHPVKHITTGEGGAILTDDDSLAEKLQILRHHGMIKDPASMTRNDGPWYYESHTLGYNGRITDFQCALGIRQLAKLGGFLERRREIARHYREALADIQGLSFQQTSHGTEHAYHLFVVHLDPTKYDRREVFEGLRAQGIAPQVHYVPVSGQPSIVQTAGSQGPFENAERYYAGCLSLPMYPALSDEEQERVIVALGKVTREVQK